MASAVDSNDSIYLNMTLSELISKLREAEAENTKLKEEVEKKTRETELMNERAELERLDKMKAEMDLEEKMKKGKEDEERHMKEVGLLWKSLEDTRKRKEQQEKSIKRLRKENRKLVEENLRSKRIWTRKFEDLTEKVLDLGNDVEILKNEREKEGSRKGSETGDTSGGTDNNGQSSGNPNQVAASGDKRRKRVLMREEGDLEERTKDAVEEELAKCREELMICKGRLAEFVCQESKFAEERGRLLEESRKAYIKGCVHGAKDCATACVDLGVNRSFEEIIGHFRHLQSQRLDVP